MMTARSNSAGGGAGRRWPLFVVAIGLVLAVGAPALWWAHRPSADAGVQITSAPAATGSSKPEASSEPSSGLRTRSARVPSAQGSDPAPVRLRIAKLGVDAPVEPVGVRPDGSMTIPEETSEVGWYRYGPAPGASQGSAVLAGHVDSAAQGAGALFELRRMEPGDRITVELADGRLEKYRVSGKETITKRRLPTERIFTRAGPDRLVIITCGGPFIKELSSYRDNLVVVAVPEV